MARRFVPIAIKLNVLIVLSLTIGIGGIAFYLGVSLTQTIERSTLAALEQEADLVYEAIENLMIPGEAPLVVDYFHGIGEINPNYEIRLFRTSGAPAFSDNETIFDVNQRIRATMFEPRGGAGIFTEPVDVQDAFVRATSLPARSVTFEQTVGDETFVRLFRPLLNLPKCTVCHGADHTIRGVIDIRNNISDSIAQQQLAIASSSGAFLILVAVVGLIMSRYMKHRFVAPLREIGATCEAVTEGVFERKSQVKNNDELGALSGTVNKMVDGLYERFVLQRYVSGSTIESISDTNKGTRTESLTMFFSDVRGFTKFTEGTEPEVVVETLNKLLGDQSHIIADYGGDIDKYVGDEIVATFAGPDGPLAAAAAAAEIHKLVAAADAERYLNLQVGIGINTGPVIVGSVGSDRRADFTVIGDNVNIAARLCSAAARGETLISGASAQHLTDKVELDGPYRLQVKGKSDALRVFRMGNMIVTVDKKEQA